MSVRVIRKGGIWKNTEDEILKAAVMKYGKNQWARIASLLSRKTAKQCKARWYEWLDPSIRKTEWSREEEEKLLHMAKIMPMQWASIAPIVGRTAAQCLEHYEKLVDSATGREAIDPADDPRRLRPGEIDPNPEAKPALPDRVDMEEIEKEMLQEARARLANTKGKKAKRKAREKQLEEARRLASLQKRRELKAAGIVGGNSSMHTKKKKKKGIDYNAEIPFQIRPAPGFYSAAEELARERFQRKNPTFNPILLQQLEGERRDEAESRARKKDIQDYQDRLKQDPTIQFNQLQDPAVRRTKLNIPVPAMNDQEILELSKLGYQPMREGEDGGSEATKDLLSNYAPTPTPRRGAETPVVDRTPARPNTILMEAQNLQSLTEAATPLVGGDNPELHPSDFSGATPRRYEARTPNPLATPLRSGSGATPGMTPSGNFTPRTPGNNRLGASHQPRDQLQINAGSDPYGERDGALPTTIAGEEFMAEEEQVAALEHKMRDAKKNLLQGLAALPTPKEYKAQFPDLSDLMLDEDESLGASRKGTSAFLRDTADLLAERRKEEEYQQDLEMRRRSAVLRRGLPRPFRVNASYGKTAKEIADMPRNTNLALEDLANELIKLELVSLLTHDAIKYPTKEVKPPAKVDPELFLKGFEVFNDRELRDARKMIDEELDLVKESVGSFTTEEFTDTWEAVYKDLIYLPSAKKFGLASHLKSEEAKAKAIQHAYDNTVDDIKKWNKRALGLEKKLGLYNQGYLKVSETKEKEIFKLHQQIDEAKTELHCFKAMKAIEDVAIPHRLQYWQQIVQSQRDQEKSLQERYAERVQHKQSLMNF